MRRRRHAIRRIPIARVQLDPREISAVEKVLKSGYLRAGRVTQDFEEEFARVVGARHAIAVSSGTAALFLAYQALLEPGDEVIVPDFTFVATAAMAAAAGCKPVLADVDPETFTLTTQEVERCMTRRTRALAPVHLYGCPADVRGLTQIAKRHGLKIIWDAAQAHGAEFRGQDVGSFPDVVCYSFYPTKNLTTGEGGMLATSNRKLAEKLRLLASHGEATRYRHILIGHNLRITDIASAIGREQLRKLPAALRRRRENARLLTKGLRGLPGIRTPRAGPAAAHAYCLYTVTLDPKVLGMNRGEFQRALLRRGIETAVHYPLPLHRQPIFRGYGSDGDFPVSTRLAKSVVSLPVHPALTRRDLHRITSAIREIAGARGRA
jgi:dTDP-4-amino-4,6-dideoxygalactose transaminase